MTDPNNISDELNELQSSLPGNHRPGDTFAVPQGYFDGFAETMMLKVRSLDVTEELACLAPALASIPKVNQYSVPAGYFQSLDPMAPNREEEEILSPLLQGLKNKQPFSIPTGYFENIEVPASSSVSSADSTELSVPGSSSDSFKMPLSGSNADSVKPDASSLSDAGSDELPAVLRNISRVTPYSVPAGYFESIDPLVAIERKPAKVISMGSFNWKRYVAAASVIAVVSLGTLLYLNRSSGITPDAVVASTVKEVPVKALDDLFALEDAADNSQSGTSKLATVSARDAQEISLLVKNVPDKDIQAFLNETASAESDIDDDPLLN